MNARVLALILVLPYMAAAQEELPYSKIWPLQLAVDALDEIEGISASLTARHSAPGNSTPFKQFLKGPNGKTEIDVDSRGWFRIPEVPRAEWEDTVLIHTLGERKLTIQSEMRFQGIRPDLKKGKTLFEMSAGLREVIKKLEGVREVWEPLEPALYSETFAITGVYFRRPVPKSGRAALKRGDTVVAEIDLAETGVATWSFSQYDPKAHTLVLDIPKGESAPLLQFVLEDSPKAAASKGAIVPRRVEQGAAEQPATAGDSK